MSAAFVRRYRWWLLVAGWVVVPLTIVVWIAWFVVTFPAALVACILGISGREEIAAWLWNHSAMVVIYRA